MRVVNLSYSVPKPNFTDPEAWLRRISFSITVMESMAQYAEVVGIYHIAHRGLLRRNGVTYHFTGYKRWQVMLPFQFNRYIKKLNPDVVIVHGLISPWQIVMLRWQMGRRLKIVVEHHAERPLKDVRQFLQRWADHYITAYLFGSLELGLPWVARKQIRNRNKIRVIIGTASIFLPMEKADARQKLGLATGKVFLWVGRLDRNKDPVTVIRAFEPTIRSSSLHDLRHGRQRIS
jgi:glycosyltransferase involved in cell wall biosynthesis